MTLRVPVKESPLESSDLSRAAKAWNLLVLVGLRRLLLLSKAALVQRRKKLVSETLQAASCSDALCVAGIKCLEGNNTVMTDFYSYIIAVSVLGASSSVLWVVPSWGQGPPRCKP